jgi:hypothetical protein
LALSVSCQPRPVSDLFCGASQGALKLPDESGAPYLNPEIQMKNNVIESEWVMSQNCNTGAKIL